MIEYLNAVHKFNTALKPITLLLNGQQGFVAELQSTLHMAVTHCLKPKALPAAIAVTSLPQLCYM